MSEATHMSVLGWFNNLHDSITVRKEDTETSTSSDSFSRADNSSVPSVQNKSSNLGAKSLLKLYFALSGYLHLNPLHFECLKINSD